MRTAAASIVVTGLALPGVACGSSPGSHVAQLGSANSQLLAYSKCMRSHGEPTFPDPNAQGQIKQQLRASGIDQDSPQWQAAHRACFQP